MTVSLEPGSRGYADPSNHDLGLVLPIRRQEFPIPAFASLNEVLEDSFGSCPIRTVAQLG